LFTLKTKPRLLLLYGGGGGVTGWSGNLGLVDGVEENKMNSFCRGREFLKKVTTFLSNRRKNEKPHSLQEKVTNKTQWEGENLGSLMFVEQLTRSSSGKGAKHLSYLHSFLICIMHQ
jgi:hypothetical protein